MTANQNEFRLVREGDEVFVEFADGRERALVKAVWARPITARNSSLSFVGRDKEEVCMVKSLDELDAESRGIAEDELARRYLLPRITRVKSARATFGVRYMRVETDRGERHFALKNASKNAVWINDDHLVLRDTLGCRYEVKPFSGLDQRSRTEIERVL